MQLGLSVVVFVAAVLGTVVLGLLLRWVDRKVTAMVQWRVGPPWYQPLADVIKLMGKENLMPATARGTGFLLAPVAAVAATGVAGAILWRVLVTPQAAFVGDLIVVLYLLAIPAAMTILGGASSGNPHGAVGAAREIKLLLSYELPLLLAILVAVAHYAADTAGLPAGQEGGWTFRLGPLAMARPAVHSISGVIALVIAILCMQAKLGQVPFDQAEAECEIMSGVYVEYSGPSLAMFLLARAMMLALLPMFLVLVFWGGLGEGTWLSYLLFALKYLLLVALVTLIRNTNPRVRIDQALRFFWFYLTPAAIVAMVLVLAGGSRGWPWL